MEGDGLSAGANPTPPEKESSIPRFLEPTHSVDQDGDEDRGGHRLSVLGVVDAADQLVVVRVEQQAEGSQDDDCEYRDDEAARAC